MQDPLKGPTSPPEPSTQVEASPVASPQVSRRPGEQMARFGNQAEPKYIAANLFGAVGGSLPDLYSRIQQAARRQGEV